MALSINSKWLSERMLARFPVFRRSSLERRIRERLSAVRSMQHSTGSRALHDRARAAATRLEAMLGRLSALTA